MQERLSEMWGSNTSDGSIVVRYVIETGERRTCLYLIFRSFLKISSISVASAERGGNAVTKIVTECVCLFIAENVQLNVSRLKRSGRLR